MKKAVAFLLAFLIFVTPITTLVKADVVIGDNDETIMNENAIILGRKLALLESLSDLALSGVTEFTISNTNNVDSYLDYLWEEIEDAKEALSNGTGFETLSNDLKSKYWTNLIQYQDYINNRGDYLAHLLPSGNPVTSLLSTYFADNTIGRIPTTKTNLSLGTFRALSELNRSTPAPSPDPDFSFLANTVDFKYPNTNIMTIESGKQIYNSVYNWAPRAINPVDYSFVTFAGNTSFVNVQGGLQVCVTTIGSIYITDLSGSNVTCSYSNFKMGWNVGGDYYVKYAGLNGTTGNYLNVVNVDSMAGNNFAGASLQTSFAGLSTCCNYINQRFRHVNIYYNGEPWVLVSDNTPNYPTLDIDGLLKIFGNDNPTEYELQPNTSIDYDQLYQVIYNAIRDNLPINQGDINYYDSHDTIYSPTIINNYGDEEGDESDLIDTILDYAVIPKFDTAIAQPMRQALTNGVVIMNNSITNVIPNEILLILGACFFLLLFAVVINRMIK